MTGVTRTSAYLVGAGLAVGLLTGPAAATPGPSDPVTPLVGTLLGQPTTADPQPAPRRSADYGHTGAPDGTLRSGCHNYRYHYVVTTPTRDWTLETFLRDPRGDGLASGTYFADSDPRRGRGHFRFCRYSTTAGRFTIRAKVHWYGAYGQDHLAWLKPSHFRLSRPR